MDITRAQIAELIPDDKNARKHNEKNIEQVMRSLREFGQHAPLVVQKATGKVLVGNGRLEAMKRLGWETADVFYVDDDNDTAIRRALADNRTAELAEWDEDVLKDLIGSFSPADIVGWDNLDIEELLGKNLPKEAKDDDFDVAAALPETPTSKLGDIYKLSNHRLMCGDSTSEAQVLQLMGTDLAHIIFTDPPIELVGYSNCGGCPGGNIEYIPEEMIRNGAEVIHLATALVVGYPPCPRINSFKTYIEVRYNVKVIVGTHPIPMKYYIEHRKLPFWDKVKMETVAPDLFHDSESIMKDYN